MRQRSENPGTFLNEATRALTQIVAPYWSDVAYVPATFTVPMDGATFWSRW